MKHQHIMLTIILTIFMLFSAGCKEDTPIQTKEAAVITVDDVSCTEAWINIKTENIQLPVIGTLTAEGVNKQITLNRADTVVYVDSLLPNKSYSFSFTVNNTTAKAEAKTMDTTSHSFTWLSFEFGGGSTSTLYGVAIINDNNIWAVGEIYLKDPLGHDDMYNLAIWDGYNWTLHKVYYVERGTKYISYISSIFVLNHNDIWLGNFTHWDGTSFISIPLNIQFESRVNKIWGTSSKDIYIAGNGGNFAHYNGSIWEKIESGTTASINDIWGIYNIRNSETEIYCAVSNISSLGDYKILKIKNAGGTVDSISWNTGRRVHSVWSPGGGFLYTAGGGIFNNKNGLWKEERDVPLYYSHCIRGINSNNIFVVGELGLFAHYNGISWTTYRELSQKSNILYSLDIKGKTVVSVGRNGNNAVIITGTQNK